ncbi:MAG TPA: Gfo/Idh/MocA family oxidoreductase [Pyrinomonadaceae bacterium]|nr:Gfo/Idh/MocA family oxidoreductase [Pyrinomonadaceae bacterium]
MRMPENKKLRTAVIGVGSLGRHHARNHAALASEGKTEFAGVCDSDEATAREIADANGCGFFTDWRELLDKVDAVSIVTPTETHAGIACEFLERGIHALVEKPIAMTLDEADQMIAAAEKGGAKLMIGHLERYNPAIVALRPHVKSPLYFEIHRVSPFPMRSLDVDVVLDVMIHDLDMVQWLVGEDIEIADVRAVGLPVLTDKVDAANARLEFSNGAVANITSSRIGTEKIRKMRFFQVRDYVAVDYVTKYVALTTMNPDAEHPLAGIKINRLEINDVEPLRAEIEAFIDSIIKDETPPVTAGDGRRALDLALKVLDSINRHTEKVF